MLSSILIYVENKQGVIFFAFKFSSRWTTWWFTLDKKKQDIFFKFEDIGLLYLIDQFLKGEQIQTKRQNNVIFTNTSEQFQELKNSQKRCAIANWRP